nr:unnamed protein product [Callosobruchus analis]
MVDALRMRTNTYGNRTTIIREGHAHISPLCPVCGDRPESLFHIIGGGPALKLREIKRHDEIGNLVIVEVAKKKRNAELHRESMHAKTGPDRNRSGKGPSGPLHSPLRRHWQASGSLYGENGEILGTTVPSPEHLRRQAIGGDPHRHRCEGGDYRMPPSGG